MGGGYQAEVANGTRNLWGEELAFIEPESEHSAASTCEGFAVSGGRVNAFRLYSISAPAPSRRTH